MKYVRDYILLAAIAGFIIALDQWTKALVRDNLQLGQKWLPSGLEWLMPYARIIHWYNTGAAFGSFQGYGWIFTILAFIVVGLIIYYYPRVDPSDWWLRIAMGMQMGGAVGNLVDRLIHGGRVVDFISIGDFPVFNVADSSITVGVAILLLGVWLKERAQSKQTPPGVDKADTSVEVKPADGSKEGAGE